MSSDRERAEQVVADVLNRPALNGYPSDILDDLGSAGFSVVPTWEWDLATARPGTTGEGGSGDVDALLEQAWGVIANASQGRWEDETPEWQDAATRWRDLWHATMGIRPGGPPRTGTPPPTPSTAATEGGELPALYWSPTIGLITGAIHDQWSSIDGDDPDALPADARRLTLAAPPRPADEGAAGSGDGRPPELWWTPEHGVLLPVSADGVDYGWYALDPLGPAKWLDERPADAVRLAAPTPSTAGTSHHPYDVAGHLPEGESAMCRTCGRSSAEVAAFVDGRCAICTTLAAAPREGEATAGGLVDDPGPSDLGTRMAHDARNLRIVRDKLAPDNLVDRVALGSAIKALEAHRCVPPAPSVVSGAEAAALPDATYETAAARLARCVERMSNCGHKDLADCVRAALALEGGERWQVTWVDSGTVDAENGEPIAAGWWVIGRTEYSDDYPFSTIHVEFSYDENGDDITERVARRVAAGLAASPRSAHEGGERPLCVNGERDAGPWEHDDGSPCDVHLCSRPYPPGLDAAWWCTDHQQHVHPAATPRPADEGAAESGDEVPVGAAELKTALLMSHGDAGVALSDEVLDEIVRRTTRALGRGWDRLLRAVQPGAAPTPSTATTSHHPYDVAGHLPEGEGPWLPMSVERAIDRLDHSTAADTISEHRHAVITLQNFARHALAATPRPQAEGGAS